MTYRIRPLPDESAGSLVYRLATKNCQTVATLGEALFGLSHQQARSDLDRIIPNICLGVLLNAIDSPHRKAGRIALPERWICSVWNSATRQHNGPIRVCGQCLDQRLYGRRYWRSCFAAACPDHAVELIKMCPHCDAPIPYFSAESGILRQHWLEGWPHCHVCFRKLSASHPAPAILIEMSRRWRSALAGKPQFGFSADAFLKLSARAIYNFKQSAPYQETAALIAPESSTSAHVSAAILIRSIFGRRVPQNVFYAAVGMPFSPRQLASELLS
jgi:hypothetical protein